MKKIILGTVFLCLMIACFTLPVSAVEGTHGDNITWTFENDILTISGSGAMKSVNYYPWNECGKTATTIIVEPGITSIGNSAFSHFRSVTSVSLPGTVSDIGGNAFLGCVSLSELPLTNAITSIDKYSFSDCSGVQFLTIPSSLTVIPYGAFSGCRGLTSVTIPGSITTLDSYAFSQCNQLTSITIPDSVTSIGGCAFAGCSSLTNVKLSENLTTMGGNVFSGCSTLEQITIPDKVTAIGGYTFSDCKALKSIYLGAGISSIKTTAFGNCYSLKAYTVSPNNPYFTTDNGFIYNKSKTQLVLGPKGYQGSYSVLPGTTTINAYACDDCTGITALAIPNSVTTIEEYAFCGCSGITSVSLSNSLTKLKLDAFSRCTALTEITFPASLQEIEQSAFNYCTSLKKITFLGMAPMIESIAFSSVTATVYYPANKPGWKDSQGLYGGMLTWVPIGDICNGKHTPTTVPAVAPTCTKTGSTAGSVCSVCGEVLSESSVVAASGHRFSSWKVVEEPTETKPGVSKRSCTVCNVEESQNVYITSESGTGSTEPAETTPAATEPPVTEPESPAETENTVDPSEPAANGTADESEPATNGTTGSTGDILSPTGDKAPVDVSDADTESPDAATWGVRDWIIVVSGSIALLAIITATTLSVIQKQKNRSK